MLFFFWTPWAMLHCSRVHWPLPTNVYMYMHLHKSKGCVGKALLKYVHTTTEVRTCLHDLSTPNSLFNASTIKVRTCVRTCRGGRNSRAKHITAPTGGTSQAHILLHTSAQLNISKTCWCKKQQEQQYLSFDRTSLPGESKFLTNGRHS